MSYQPEDVGLRTDNTQATDEQIEDLEEVQEWLLAILELIDTDGVAQIASSLEGVNQVFIGALDIPLVIQTHPISARARYELRSKMLSIGDDSDDGPWVGDVRAFLIGRPWDLQANNLLPEFEPRRPTT